MASTDAGVTGPTRARIEEKTLRGDRWWLAPWPRSWCSRRSSSTRRGGRSRAATTTPRRTSRRSTRPASATASRARRDFGQPFGWWPLSPALIILIFPLGFRMTCYYYRKAYYRAFWLSRRPARSPSRTRYSGETRFPLILQNVHRYFWYAAMLVALMLTYDTRAGLPQRRTASGATWASARC